MLAGTASFEVQFYLDTYADLLAAFGMDYHAAYLHWIMWGTCEGRDGFPGD